MPVEGNIFNQPANGRFVKFQFDADPPIYKFDGLVENLNSFNLISWASWQIQLNKLNWIIVSSIKKKKKILQFLLKIIANTTIFIY